MRSPIQVLQAVCLSMGSFMPPTLGHTPGEWMIVARVNTHS